MKTEQDNKPQNTKYTNENVKNTSWLSGDENIETPATHAIQALGFNHCKRKPCINVGSFCFSIVNRGVDEAIKYPI
jgi:hypothetical protein